MTTSAEAAPSAAERDAKYPVLASTPNSPYRPAASVEK
jgi:hypothetical protein